MSARVSRRLTARQTSRRPGAVEPLDSRAPLREGVARVNSLGRPYSLSAIPRKSDEAGYAAKVGGARSFASEGAAKAWRRVSASARSPRTSGRSNALVGGSAPSGACRRGALLWSRACFSREVTADSTGGDEFAKRVSDIGARKSAGEADKRNP